MPEELRRRHRVVRQPARRAAAASVCRPRIASSAGGAADRRIANPARHRPVDGRRRPAAARRPRCRGSTGCGARAAVGRRRKKTPEVLARIQALMTHETAGDPVSGLKWTHHTTAKLAHELRGLGIHVCPQTVARLLKAMGYSLRVNHKKLAGASHPNRDQQFRYITELRERCAADNLPVISVDTKKKKELVGAFRNPGAKWDRSPELVNDHDFPSDAEGLAIPYGIYDPRANAGTVFVGRTADTPAFAVDCIEKWWRTEGRKHYPPSPEPADPRRRRRQQQFHGARLEVQPPTSPLQPARLARHRGPLPARHVEVEPHRTPPVLRNQQELGGPPPRQLRDHPELPAHHPHLHRTACARPPRAQDLPRPASRSPTPKCESCASLRTASCRNGTTPSNPLSEKTESIFAPTLRWTWTTRWTCAFAASRS